MNAFGMSNAIMAISLWADWRPLQESQITNTERAGEGLVVLQLGCRRRQLDAGDKRFYTF